MSGAGCHALMAGAGNILASRISPPMRHCGIDLHWVDWSTGVLEVISGLSFDVIITSFPHAIYPEFLQRLRQAGAPSSSCPLLLLVPPEQREEALELLGAGVDRVVFTDMGCNDLIDAAANLVTPAPRFTLHAPARLVVRLPERRPLLTVCQTENLSASGMLVRGWQHYPRSTRLDFELRIRADLWLRGAAEVVRTTHATRETIPGFAARFVAFERDHQAKLATLLEQLQGQLLGEATDVERVRFTVGHLRKTA